MTFSCVLVWLLVKWDYSSSVFGAHKNLVGNGASSMVDSSGRRADGAIFIINQYERFSSRVSHLR